MTAPTPLRHAGVRFPPPLIYVVGLVTGWLVNRWRPLPITTMASTGRIVVAALFLVAWFALMLWALGTFRRARTAVIPHKPATAVVTTGPYRFTRNPMYVSMVACYLGVAALLNSWWALIFLPVVVLVVQTTVIAREERYLASAFPPEYAAYRQRVRRWL